MPSPVRIEADVWDDWRFNCLAAALGVELETCVGRMAKMWSFASDKFVYAVPEAAIRTYLKSPDAVDALVESNLGERLGDGTVRLKGSKRFEDLWAKRERFKAASRKGGEARRDATKNEQGQFVSGDTDVQPISQPTASPETSRQPADSQQKTSPSDSGSGSGSDSTEHSPSVSVRGARKRRSPEVPIPDDWKPNETSRSRAETLGVDLERAAYSFKNHAVSKDRRCAGLRGWDAAFLNWLDREKPAQRNGDGRGGVRDLLDWQLKRVAEAEAAEREGRDPEF